MAPSNWQCASVANCWGLEASRRETPKKQPKVAIWQRKLLENGLLEPVQLAPNGALEFLGFHIHLRLNALWNSALCICEK